MNKSKTSYSNILDAGSTLMHTLVVSGGYTDLNIRPKPKVSDREVDDFVKQVYRVVGNDSSDGEEVDGEASNGF